MKKEQIDGISNDTLIDIEKRLGDIASTYTTVIIKKLPKDMREPPGDLHGTGSYFEVDGRKYLLTCEHVGKEIQEYSLCASFNGSDIVFSLPNIVSALMYPADVAITTITDNTQNLSEHKAQTIPYSLFAERHLPIDDELMYIAGSPGELSGIWPATITNGSEESGIHLTTTIYLMCEIQEYFDPILSKDNPPPLEDMHFLLPYTPEFATYMNNDHESPLPRAPGLSGSLVWNTRFREITNSGAVWQPSDARVTGIVWGNSTKAGVLVATPVEYIRQLIETARKNLAEGKPYWEPPNN